MSNFKAKILSGNNRFVSRIETLGTQIGYLFLLSFQYHRIDRDGKEYCESYAKAPWTIEISNFENVHHSFYI